MKKRKPKTKQKTKPASKTGDAPFAAPDWSAAASTMWAIDKIVPFQDNPRTHPEEQIETLAKLLTKYGPDQPIVVDEQGVILKGHGRLMAAKRAGFEQFPVSQRVGLSEDDKRAIRISDNQIALLSGWDLDQLKFDVGELKTSDFDVSLLGFTEAQLAEFAAGGPTAPGQFAEFGENIKTEHECPKCHYRWSGHSGMVPAGVKPKNGAKKK